MRIRKFFIAWVPAIVWMGVIFVLSSQSTLPKFPRAVPDKFSEVGGHLTEYAILAVLCRRALQMAGRTRHPTLWAFVIAVLYGITDEWHQFYVPGRHSDPMDLLVDSIGAFLSLAVVHVWEVRQPAPDREAT